MRGAEVTMKRSTQIERALAFREMHHGKRLLLLPNAWDVVSAKLYEVEGFRAVGTTSAGISATLGQANDAFNWLSATLTRDIYVPMKRRLQKREATDRQQLRVAARVVERQRPFATGLGRVPERRPERRGWDPPRVISCFQLVVLSNVSAACTPTALGFCCKSSDIGEIGSPVVSGKSAEVIMNT